MVKNSTGGSHAKKLGRKHANGGPKQALRLAINDGEFYACVNRVYGNGRFNIVNLKGEEYMCVMGNKFRGRFKRDNLVALNSWILAGAREWESSSILKKPNCDLLEVYSTSEVDHLRARVYENWGAFPLPGLIATIGGGSDIVDDLGVEFTDKEAFRDEHADNDDRGGDDVGLKRAPAKKRESAKVGKEVGSGVVRAVVETIEEDVNIDDI